MVLRNARRVVWPATKKNPKWSNESSSCRGNLGVVFWNHNHQRAKLYKAIVSGITLDNMRGIQISTRGMYKIYYTLFVCRGHQWQEQTVLGMSEDSDRGTPRSAVDAPKCGEAHLIKRISTLPSDFPVEVRALDEVTWITELTCGINVKFQEEVSHTRTLKNPKKWYAIWRARWALVMGTSFVPMSIGYSTISYPGHWNWTQTP